MVPSFRVFTLSLYHVSRLHFMQSYLIWHDNPPLEVTKNTGLMLLEI